MVVCRLCEEKVPSSTLQLHMAVCRHSFETAEVDRRLDKDVEHMVEQLSSARRQALHTLVTIAVQRHNLLCSPLEQLIVLAEASLAITNLSPLHHLGRLTELMRELVQLRKAEDTGLGGSVFYSCASQLKAILAEKVSHVQELINLDPAMLDPSAKPIRHSSKGAQHKPSIKDFTLLRVLASGGFAQVGLTTPSGGPGLGVHGTHEAAPLRSPPAP